MSKLVQGEGAYAEIAARYPAKHVRLNKNKRADFKQLKTDFLKENGRKEWKKKVADEKSANHLARLRYRTFLRSARAIDWKQGRKPYLTICTHRVGSEMENRPEEDQLKSLIDVLRSNVSVSTIMSFDRFRRGRKKKGRHKRKINLLQQESRSDMVHPFWGRMATPGMQLQQSMDSCLIVICHVPYVYQGSR